MACALPHTPPPPESPKQVTPPRPPSYARRRISLPPIQESGALARTALLFPSPEHVSPNNRHRRISTCTPPRRPDSRSSDEGSPAFVIKNPFKLEKPPQEVIAERLTRGIVSIETRAMLAEKIKLLLADVDLEKSEVEQLLPHHVLDELRQAQNVMLPKTDAYPVVELNQEATRIQKWLKDNAEDAQVQKLVAKRQALNAGDIGNQIARKLAKIADIDKQMMALANYPMGAATLAEIDHIVELNMAHLTKAKKDKYREVNQKVIREAATLVLFEIVLNTPIDHKIEFTDFIFDGKLKNKFVGNKVMQKLITDHQNTKVLQDLEKRVIAIENAEGHLAIEHYYDMLQIATAEELIHLKGIKKYANPIKSLEDATHYYKERGLAYFRVQITNYKEKKPHDPNLINIIKEPVFDRSLSKLDPDLSLLRQQVLRLHR